MRLPRQAAPAADPRRRAGRPHHLRFHDALAAGVLGGGQDGEEPAAAGRHLAGDPAAAEVVHGRAGVGGALGEMRHRFRHRGVGERREDDVHAVRAHQPHAELKGGAEQAEGDGHQQDHHQGRQQRVARLAAAAHQVSPSPAPRGSRNILCVRVSITGPRTAGSTGSGVCGVVRRR